MSGTSYQGFEILKFQQKMKARMWWQAGTLCLKLQPLLLIVLVFFRIDLSYEMVPAPHRELAWKWPLARLENALSLKGTFHLTAEEVSHWWPGVQAKDVEVSVEELVVLPYRYVFSRDAHWGLAFLLSFTVWPVRYLVRRFSPKISRRFRKARRASGKLTWLREGLSMIGKSSFWPWVGERFTASALAVGNTGLAKNLTDFRAEKATAVRETSIVVRTTSLLITLKPRIDLRHLKVAGCILLQALIFVSLVRLSVRVQYEMVPAAHRELAVKWPVARLQRALGFNGIFHLHSEEPVHWWNGKRQKIAVVRAKDLVKLPYRQIFISKGAHWRLALFVSFFSFVPFPVLLWVAARRTRRIEEDEHIDGARLSTEEELADLCTDGILYVGEVRISEVLSRRHILIVGQSGSGKSNLTIQHLLAIQAAGRRAVVNDFKGDLVERYLRPGTDLILNPLDRRGVGWTIFNDIETQLDLISLVAMLIPLGKGNDIFWNAAARDVLRGVIAWCYKFGQRTNRALCEALAGSIRDLAEMCRATQAGRAGARYLEDPCSKMAEGIIAVLTAHTDWLHFAPDGDFSLRQWAACPADSTIFITSLDEAADIMKPYLSLVTEFFAKRFLSLPEIVKAETTIYLLLDELGNMHRLPSVKHLLTAGRSKGVVVEVGIQDLAGMESVYGREDTKTIINNCGSKMIMNLGESEAAELCSELCGDEDCWQFSTSYTIDPDGQRVTENLSRQQKRKRVVTATEIKRLQVGHGYFMLPGGNPALVEVPWTKESERKVRNDRFLMRPGLSMEDLQVRCKEKGAEARQVLQGEVPEELKQLHNRYAPERKVEWKGADDPAAVDEGCRSGMQDLSDDD